MTWVKICGITNLEDAQTAVEAGADALGFVFFEKSSRYMPPEAVRDIVRQLPASTEKIGVFVDENLKQIEEVAERVGLTGIQMYVSLSQLHRDEDRLIRGKTANYIALSVDEFVDGRNKLEGFAWPEGMKEAVRAIFLDAGTKKEPGGTGKTFDWANAAPTVRMLQRSFRVVVAGGLTPTNVSEAMRILRPWGVDVSTGVEARPGKKDPEKVRAFVAAVRDADQKA
jgi:phosphoribosylanthranilate isomerase